jgi:4-amino-4-deoxy-L-arabinose transferase-like glycosyltransferase
MSEREDSRLVWIIVFGLLLLTRLPVMSNYLSIDNVNLALSLEKFDPRIHQPQPPGYPFFVFTARVVNLIFRDAERTFAAISILASGVSLSVAFALASRMFSQWAGLAAAFLLLVNPVFWHSSLDGPLRPYLALFSLLTAYCCWRCWNGEKRFAIWGAVALGAGSGFRPDLAAFLFPLWLISTWVGTKSWRVILQGVAALALVVLTWVGALVIAMGGISTFTKIMLDYAVDQSRQESVVLGSSLLAWLRQVNRLVIWNGLGVATWVWAVPLYFRYRDRLPLTGAHGVFFFIWLVPGLIVQALVHIAAPGHTLFSVASLCILGAYVLSLAPARHFLLGAALIMNVMLFLGFFSLPAGTVNASDSLPSLKNAMLFGTFES